MAILLMFNEADELSVNEILAGTEIETDNDYLFKVLSTLLKVKLLVCKSRSISDDELVSLEDTVTCNHKYKRFRGHLESSNSLIFLVKRKDSTFPCLSNQNKNKNQMQLFKKLKTIVASQFRYIFLPLGCSNK